MVTLVARQCGMLLVLLLPAPKILGQLTAARVTVRQDHALAMTQGETRTVYALSDHEEHAELVADRLADPRLKTELRFNVWRGETQSHGDDLALPIARRLDYFSPLMERLLTERPESSYGLLFYGYRELFDRLPALAAMDPGWDRRTGHPVDSLHGYEYIATLLDRGNAYRELAKSISTLHYSVHIQGGLEELRVLPAAKLSESQRRGLPQYTKPMDLLPSHIAIDFTLTKERNGT